MYTHHPSSTTYPTLAPAPLRRALRRLALALAGLAAVGFGVAGQAAPAHAASDVTATFTPKETKA